TRQVGTRGGDGAAGPCDARRPAPLRRGQNGGSSAAPVGAGGAAFHGSPAADVVGDPLLVRVALRMAAVAQRRLGPISVTSTSNEVRWLPSLSVHSRWRSWPVTITRAPWVMDSAMFSAMSRQQVQRRNVAPLSVHWLVVLSKRRSLEASVTLATAMPDWVKRSSGSRVAVPTMVISGSPGMVSAPVQQRGGCGGCWWRRSRAVLGS